MTGIVEVSSNVANDNTLAEWPGIVSRFQLVILASHRSKQLLLGAQPRIVTDRLKRRNTSIALEELKRGLIPFKPFAVDEAQNMAWDTMSVAVVRKWYMFPQLEEKLQASRQAEQQPVKTSSSSANSILHFLPNTESNSTNCRTSREYINSQHFLCLGKSKIGKRFEQR